MANDSENLSTSLHKIVIFFAGTLLDFLIASFLYYKMIKYFFDGEDQLGGLFACAIALWAISSILWTISTKGR